MSKKSKDARKQETKKKSKLSLKEKRKIKHEKKEKKSLQGERMKHKERYTIKSTKHKILGRTNDIKEALKIQEEYKQEGAYIDDRKSPDKHRNSFIRK